MGIREYRVLHLDTN